MLGKEILKQAKQENRTQLTEIESKELLKEVGIPVIEAELATTKKEAISLSKRVGFPVVLKVASLDIIHKSDSGGVKLGLTNVTQVGNAYSEIMSAVRQRFPQARIQGVSVQKMARPAVEVIIGMSKDAQFGPVLMFGLGGILVEVLKDVSFRLVPVTKKDAGEMVREIRGYRLLQGYRGQEPADISALERLIVRVSEFVEQYSQIKELDLNPVFADKDGAMVVDARIILETAEKEQISNQIYMPKSSYQSLEFLFQPRSIALVGITTDAEHWTRTFLDSLLEFEFEPPIYLVNPRGSEIRGLKVYRSLGDIPHAVDYVIGTVPAKAAPGLVEECAGKGVKAIHFCTAGFRETGEEEGARLEAELVELSQRTGVRIIGPNCMGIYCPQSRLSFSINFPKESGPVGFITQSGGNATSLVKEGTWRGVRFSKVISYGNACDLGESDFLEYLTADPDTKIIALYVEGVKDGRRFREVLKKAAEEKVVILLKGGLTQGGARAAVSHTGALAGNEVIWESLCQQLGVIWVRSMDELTDVLGTLLFMPLPKGGRVALIGVGGGASVLITDQFEKSGLIVPPLPPEIQNHIREFTPISGNILRNPVDYSQAMLEIEKLAETVSLISRWDGIDFLTLFLRATGGPPGIVKQMPQIVDATLKASKASSKPIALVYIPSLLSREATKSLSVMQELTAFHLPVYNSFTGAASAISLVLNYNQTWPGKISQINKRLFSNLSL